MCNYACVHVPPPHFLLFPRPPLHALRRTGHSNTASPPAHQHHRHRPFSGFPHPTPPLHPRNPCPHGGAADAAVSVHPGLVATHLANGFFTSRGTGWAAGGPLQPAVEAAVRGFGDLVRGRPGGGRGRGGLEGADLWCVGSHGWLGGAGTPGLVGCAGEGAGHGRQGVCAACVRACVHVRNRYCSRAAAAEGLRCASMESILRP